MKECKKVGFNVENMNFFTGVGIDEPHPTSFIRPINIACRRGFYDIVYCLILRGCNPDSPYTGKQETPCESAMRAANLDTLKLLISFGALMPLDPPSNLVYMNLPFIKYLVENFYYDALDRDLGSGITYLHLLYHRDDNFEKFIYLIKFYEKPMFI